MKTCAVIAVVFLLVAGAYGRKDPPIVCDGAVCIEDLKWVNYYAGCFMCLRPVVKGTFINNSDYRLHGVQLTFEVMANDKTVLRNTWAAVDAVPPNGGRWPFEADVAQRVGKPAFVRPTTLTASINQDGRMIQDTVEINLGVAPAR